MVCLAGLLLLSVAESCMQTSYLPPGIHPQASLGFEDLDWMRQCLSQKSFQSPGYVCLNAIVKTLKKLNKCLYYSATCLNRTEQ
jgi:hypothetical protein